MSLQVSAALGADQPTPQATSGGEPAYELACGPALTIWRKVRDPGARECCALLVRAKAGLWTAPERSRKLGERALGLCPSGLEAAATVAAARLAGGDAAGAHLAFEGLSSGRNAEVWGKLPTLDRLLAARAASLSGNFGRALVHYRSVILELDRLPSPHERARVLLEAAMIAARSTPPESAEALAYLRQSADHPSPRLAIIRSLFLRAIGLAPEEAGPSGELEEARELTAWMQGQAPPPRGAPGELLPVLSPQLLAELLPEPDRPSTFEDPDPDEPSP